MEIFLTLAVSLAMIVLGVLLIHLLNSQHGDGMSSFHYGRSGMPVARPASSVPRKIRGRAGAGGTDDRRDHRDGGRGRLRPRRRTRKGAE